MKRLMLCCWFLGNIAPSIFLYPSNMLLSLIRLTLWFYWGKSKSKGRLQERRHPPSVLWHCWLGHQTCKNRRPYNLYCVGADVKPCSINQSIECHSTLESALNQFSLQENIVLSSWVYYRSIVTSCITCHFRDIFAYSNINVIDASLKSTFSGLQLCRWQYDSHFIRLAVVASQICESLRIFDRIAVGLGFHQATLVWCPCSSGNPSEFLDKIYPAKTTGGTTVQRKLHDPNFSRFLTDPPMWWTDGRQHIAHSAYVLSH